jgi:hypothetical protein
MRIIHGLSLAALVLAAALTLHHQVAPSATAAGGAQRWRYLTLQMHGDYSITESFYVPTGSGEQITKLLAAPTSLATADPKVQAAWSRAVAQAGLDGWEMVNVIRATGFDIAYADIIYFKRPL